MTPATDAAVEEYIFPTTFAQQRLWFLDRLQPGNVSYSLPWSIRMTGLLHLEALESSVNEIVRRHEILRTTFALVDGEPVQRVASELHVPLPVVDLGGEADPESQARKMANDEALRPLDLERGPLVRTTVLRLGPEDHVLLLTMHHIVFDGWSRNIFVREVADLYSAYREGREPRLPALRLQYADYAVWQRQ